MDSLQQNGFFVIIPVHNEEGRIEQVLQGVKKYADHIIVVDDGSSDRTYLAAKNAAGKNIMVLRHKINLGKGAAVKTGCEAALKLGAQIFIIMDGDGQHSPDDIPKLVEKLKNDDLDFVCGARTFDKNTPIIRALGNKFITKIIKILSDISLDDVLCGFKGFTAQAYQKIIWVSADYSMEPEIVIRVRKNNLKYGQVPIQTIYRDSYKGMTIFNGLKIILELFKFKFL